MQRVVAEVNRFVHAHGQRLTDRLERALGAHAQDGHLAAVGFLDLQGLLDGVLIDLIDDCVARTSVERLVVIAQLAFRPGVGHLLDQYNDVHARQVTGR